MMQDKEIKSSMTSFQQLWSLNYDHVRKLNPWTAMR